MGIHSSNIERIYTRRYIKIQNALANLGGISNFLILIGFLILKLVPFNGINFILANRFYSFQMESEKLSPEFEKSAEEKEKLISFNMSNFNNRLDQVQKNKMNNGLCDQQIISASKENEKNTEFSETSKHMENLKKANKLRENYTNFIKDKKKNENFDLSLKVIFSKCSRNLLLNKLKVIKNAEHKIDNEIDILYILEKLKEIDRLKLLLLNPIQLFLFNQFSKPEIFLKTKDNDVIYNMVLDFNTLEKSMLYCEKLKQRNQKFENDEQFEDRLLKLIDRDFKNILEKF